jgi:putative transposase
VFELRKAAASAGIRLSKSIFSEQGGTATMEKDKVVAFRGKDEVADPLTELLREKATVMLQAAVEAEAEEFLAHYRERRDGLGRQQVIGNGYLPRREIVTGLGPLAVSMPRVRDRSGEGIRFCSSLVPAYVRRAKAVDALLPWLYLKGIAAGDIPQALAALLGQEVKGLSANVVGRLKAKWGEEYESWRRSDLCKDNWVYLWADGIYSALRGEDQRLCLLVVVGVNERGQKRFLAIEDGIRESADSWRAVLRDLKERGLIMPQLAIGDGALGFWKALSELYPQMRHQRCWMHKTGNVLNYLPKHLQGKAKSDLHAIWMAATKQEALKAFEHFVQSYQAKYPKAVECLAKDKEALLAFYDFPAEHWSHIRTSNPIESSFATIRHRTDQTKGAVSRSTLLGLVYKLAMCAENSFRRLNGFNRLAEVIRGVKFVDGVREEESVQQKVAA